MSRLLFLFEGDMPTISITRDVFSNLKDKRIQSDFMYISDVKPEDIDHHDIIVLIRPTNVFSWKIGKRAKEAGHIVITFCDDDLLNQPKTEPMMPWRRRGLIKALDASDIIWSSSKYIIEKYINYTRGKRGATTDTILTEDELKGIDVEHRDNEKVKIVYAAASSHAALFEKYITPVLPSLFSEFGDGISLSFVGVHPSTGGYACEYIQSMPLLEYRKFMKEQHYDIGLAPLHDNEFSKCKYFNKYIEYTMQGSIGIYSNTEPYTYVVKNNENGLLADNSPDAWLDALRRAITDKNLRLKCTENAVKYLREKHSEEAIMNRIKEDIPELNSEGNVYPDCKSFMSQKLVYILYRPLDWLYLTFYYMRHAGLSEVIDRAKKRIFKQNAYSRRDKS